MKAFKKVLHESSLARVFQHTKSRNIGMISASRGDLPASENNRRHNAMAADIRKAGYGFIKTQGHYVENFGKPNARSVKEKAFLVVGKKSDDKGGLLGHLKHLGQKYGQDSILHKSFDSDKAVLHGTNKTGFPGEGKTHYVGTWHPNRTGEFFSKMKNKTFNFEEGFEFVNDLGFFSRAEHLY
jgi:hypothetical protein